MRASSLIEVAGRETNNPTSPGVLKEGQEMTVLLVVGGIVVVVVVVALVKFFKRIDP